MSTPNVQDEAKSKEAKQKKYIESKANKNTLLNLPGDAVSNIITFLDMRSATRFAKTSLEAKTSFTNTALQNKFWQERVFQDLTEFPILQKQETYKSFYTRNYYLVNRIEKFVANTNTHHSDWISLFANVIQNGLEKLMVKFSNKITNYAELCSNPESSANTYLHLAAMHGHKHIIAFLLEQHVPVDPIDGGIFYMPTSSGMVTMMRAKYGSTPLCYAASHGYLDCMILLIGAGADINFQPLDTGDTPLHSAAKNGRLSCFRLLIEKGATTDLTNRMIFGETAIDLALRNNTPEWNKYLYDKFNVTARQCGCVIS